MGSSARRSARVKGRTVTLTALTPELAADCAFQDRSRRESRRAARLSESHLNATASPPSTLRPGLRAVVDDVIARGLAKDPARRFGAAGELAEAILAAFSTGYSAPPQVFP
jgi:hypothetical protein